MMKWVHAALVLGAASLAVPASAAPQEQLSCIYDAFTAEQRTAVATELTKLITNPEAQLDPAIEKMANGTVEKAAASCKKRHKWDDQQISASEDYASAQIIMVHLRADPALAGIDLSRLDAAVPSQMGKPMVELVMARDPSDAEMESYRKAAIAAGIAENDVGRLSRAVVYASMKHSSEVAKAIFAAPAAVKK